MTEKKRKMPNSKRDRARANRALKIKFEEAIADGYTSRRDIFGAMGILGYELTNFFEDNPKCYTIYAGRRRGMADVAADNIQDIIDDKHHPQHYAASVYVAKNYKSDLDNVMESKTNDESLSIGNGVGGDVIIKFKATKNVDDGEEGKQG